MNIKITHNWLLDYLDTDAGPYDVQKYLSLSGPSIETVEKIDDDYVYDIEITSNRIDMASVLGIAREAQAILPQYGIKAKIKNNPLEQNGFSRIGNGLSRIENPLKLDIHLKNEGLCSRFMTIVLDNVTIDKAPEFMNRRLTLSGIKSINNVVNISNYLMMTFGQPTHVFDYDKIGAGKMIMRESKAGEKIITLDDKEVTLPGGDIVIEDGSGRLIDLCGIMGGANSAVSENTKRIVLFVQTYNKQKIRRTSMLTGQRTVAATYFEKGLDEERVEPTLACGAKLLEKYASAKIASPLYDIYPQPYRPKQIEINIGEINHKIGVEIPREKIVDILENLGFLVLVGGHHDVSLRVAVPSWRHKDISIKEDIVEEIARIYGYHNLPNILQPIAYVKESKEMEKLFTLQFKVKTFLKHLGLNEVLNYSMISKELIGNFGMETAGHLTLANAMNEELKYMRISLLPSLVKNIKDNQGRSDKLKLFELAKVYIPANSLPEELYKLAIAVDTDYFDLKGIVEALYRELNINFDKFDKSIIRLNSNTRYKLEIKKDVYMVELDFQTLIDNYKILPQYHPINPYSVIKLDLNIQKKEGTDFAKIKKIAYQTSKLLTNIEFVSVFQNKLTFRFYFNSPERNITEEEAKEELEKINSQLH